jgi:phosphopantothenoylcysteine decarboxylase/phosphopantothenate--cysteine ligase
MTILITAGPTQEPLDAMRILSNRSTGELGTQLALALAQAGHQVIVLRGTGATAGASQLQETGVRIIPFTTTEDLRKALEQTSREEARIDAIFHAAAVSDFYFSDAPTGKIPTTEAPLTLTLKPTPKLLPLLRGWFPSARIIGWKFEASGDKNSALGQAAAQILKCRTDACVLNGPSYGEGFGFLNHQGLLHHLPDRTSLCTLLCDFTGDLKA